MTKIEGSRYKTSVEGGIKVKRLLVMAIVISMSVGTALDLSMTAARAQYTFSRNPDDYHAAYVGQNSYPTLHINGCYQFVIQFRNTGRATWHQGVVNLGTDRPRDRIPGFIREDRCSGQPSGWISGNRVVLREQAVPPVGVGTFVFWYTVTRDHATGTFREYFRPVADDVTWMEDCGCYWDVRVVTPTPPQPRGDDSGQPSRPFSDTCDSPRNAGNCVYYARCRVPSLPYNLFTYAQKVSIINSSTPRTGAVAVMNVGLPWGHLAVVEHVYPDGRIVVKESNYRAGQFTVRRGFPGELRVTGYYQP
ncbi:MAG: CHAP domain-containing protein [Armatimonadota bacterium]|nr:CHAP domain-containing protein [Armatimonadota bacterium]